ncbi:MAG: hypothetical protein M3259_03650 [Actinomycetota bacterium]|nr:hypothetical protein [Actinomycetota bacterium]
MSAHPYPPEGARLKLARAHGHLQELRSEIDAFFESPPFRWVLYRDESGLNYSLVGYLNHWLTEMVPTIIGDCLQNMRIALDHLAWALAESTGEEPPRNTAFPIYLDSADFHARTNKGKPAGWSGLKKIEAIPDEAQAVIEELQPYHGDDPSTHPLWILNEYSRIDRHRTLSVMYAVSDYTDFDVGTLDSSGKLVSLPKDMVTNLTLTGPGFFHGMDLARFTLKEPVPDLRVKYDSPFYITFGQRYISVGDPLEVLGDIHGHIEQTVLPKFARFF